MKIGIFDSGIGGLSVLHQARRIFPEAHYIYYADRAHAPYGEKTPEQLREFMRGIFSFMIEKKVEAILIACNTATSVLTMEYRNQFPVPIIGMEPAVKKAVELYRDENKRILVAATPITVQGEKLHHLIEKVDEHHNVDSVAFPGLVLFAEKMDFDQERIDTYLKNAMSDMNLNQYSCVVLGCTHFNYFKNNFVDVMPKGIHFADGNEGAVNQMLRVLGCKPKNMNEDGGVEYYNSGEPASDDMMHEIEIYMKKLDDVYMIK